MKAGYVRNLVRHPRVRVKLRKGLPALWLPKDEKDSKVSAA
jgi:hypothetical protein